MEFDPRRGKTGIRFVKSLIAAGGDLENALHYAQSQKSFRDTPAVAEILKANIDAMSGVSNPTLIAAPGADLLTLVRPGEIIGKIAGPHRIPFDVLLNTQSGSATAHWVGEGKPAPLTAQSYGTQIKLPRLKVIAMGAVSGELARSPTADAEAELSRDLSGAGVQASDEAFIDPSNSGIANVKPAAVTYGAPTFASSGNTAPFIAADITEKLVGTLVDAGSTLQFGVLIMHTITAAWISGLTTSGGGRAFPDINVRGGLLMGMPVITSASVPRVGSPLSGYIILLDGSRIWIADEGQMTLDVSTQATVEMKDDPTNDAVTPTATTMTSAFQTGTVIVRSTRILNFKAASGAAAVLVTDY